MVNEPRWTSNKAKVADRKHVDARVENGALYLNNDPKTDTYVQIELTPPPPAPVPLPEDPFEMELDMAGYTEISGKRLIPMAAGHLMYDLDVVGYGTIVMAGGSGSFEFNPTPFAVSVLDDGTVNISQRNGTEGLNPGDTFLLTILQITSYRTYKVVNGVNVISAPKTGLNIKVRGQTVITDTLAPTIQSMTPGGAGVAIASDIVLTMSENVKAGTGNIVLWNETTNAQIAAFDVASSPYVTFNLSQVTIAPPADLPYGTQVSVRMAAGVILDLANNPIAAISGSVWSFTTLVYIPPISNMDPDIVLTSVAQINATLTSWAADPAGTAPAGKGALQDRVIGISTILNGMAISSKNMPMKVFIRPVGSYSEAVINGYKIPACSVYVNGGVALTGCTNIHLWRMDVRAANGTTGYGTGLVHLSGCTRCGFIRSVARGWPHALVQGTYGTTAAGVRVTGGSDNLVEYPAVFFAYDTDYSLFGTSQRFTWRGCTARHSGGNQFKLATGSIANDMVHEYCLQDRAYHPYKGLHGDYMQWNNGAIANRYNIRKSIMYHGHWTGEYNPNSNGTGVSNATQTIFSSPGGTTTAGDQNMFEDCLVVSSQSRGLDRMPGPAILTAQNNSFLDSLMPLTPIKQTGSSPWPRIIAVDVSIANYVTLQFGNSGMVGNEGTGGIALRVSPDHHEILDDHVSIPTDLTDLYDIRPVSGRRTDPLYSTPSQRVGAFKLWSDLYLGDNRIVLSKQGWPVATVFKEDFDPLNRFGGTHSGNYDSNGDSI